MEGIGVAIRMNSCSPTAEAGCVPRASACIGAAILTVQSSSFPAEGIGVAIRMKSCSFTGAEACCVPLASWTQIMGVPGGIGVAILRPQSWALLADEPSTGET